MKELSLTGAIELFSTVGLEVEHENHKALEKSIKLVQRTAKGYLGTYDAKYPTVWLELRDSTKRNRVSKGFPANEPLLRTGALRDSIQITVHHDEASVGTNSQIGVWQELGTSRMVPRPFLEPALKEKTPEVLKIIGETVVGKLSGEARKSDDD